MLLYSHTPTKVSKASIWINIWELRISDNQSYKTLYSTSKLADKLSRFRNRFGLLEGLLPTVGHYLTAFVRTP